MSLFSLWFSINASTLDGNGNEGGRNDIASKHINGKDECVHCLNATERRGGRHNFL